MSLHNKLLTASLLALGAALVSNAELRSSQTDIARSLNTFNTLFKEVQLNYVDSIDAAKSVNNAIHYMLDEIDPYTQYFPADETEDLEQMATGEYGGVGAVINKGRDGRVRFAEPQANTPSWNAGIRGGDVILQIDTMAITAKHTVEDVSRRLRGIPGTALTVKVNRPYVSDSLLTFNLIRDKIHSPAVVWCGLVGDDSKVGYIQVGSFTETAPEEFKAALNALLKRGITSLVIDLQNNPGGLLESAVEIVGMFVKKGTEVVRTKGRNTTEERIYTTPDKPIAQQLPLAVLINESSASAAEIVAGAMQDLDRAVIVGQRSYGKGLVQSSRPLPYDAMVKITVAKYYIPSGRLIQAIDYSRRNADGSVARTPDSLTTAYKTLHGREVRDGGGITPDVKIDPTKSNRLLYGIRVGGWDVDYATKYMAEHPNPVAPHDFVITDSVFNDFVAFVKPSELKYDNAYSETLKYLREAVTDEGYLTDSVAAQLAALEQMLQPEHTRDFSRNRKPIEFMLTDAIVARYAHRPGAVEATLKFNQPLREAISILSSPRYKAILNP